MSAGGANQITIHFKPIESDIISMRGVTMAGHQRVFFGQPDVREMTLMDTFEEEIIFFFQAEDGIRDDLVTGVQTCALPICNESAEFGIEAETKTGISDRLIGVIVK